MAVTNEWIGPPCLSPWLYFHSHEWLLFLCKGICIGLVKGQAGVTDSDKKNNQEKNKQKTPHCFNLVRDPASFITDSAQ